MTDIEAIKKAWSLVDEDILDKRYIITQARCNDMEFVAFATYELVEEYEFNREDAEKIAFFICEHYGLVK